MDFKLATTELNEMSDESKLHPEKKSLPPVNQLMLTFDSESHMWCLQ